MAKFCKRCGERLEAPRVVAEEREPHAETVDTVATSETVPPPEKETRVNKTKPRTKSTGITKASIIVLVVALTLAFVYAVFYVVGATSLSDDAANDNEESYAEIAAEAETEADSTDELHLLRLAIGIARLELPVSIGDGMEFTDIDLIGDYAVYIISCDEEFVDVSLIESGRDGVKANIVAALRSDTDEDLAHLVKLCKQANKGLAYKYVGKPSGTTCTIYIPCNEL